VLVFRETHGILGEHFIMLQRSNHL